jgi:TPR repeat protein
MSCGCPGTTVSAVALLACVLATATAGCTRGTRKPAQTPQVVGCAPTNPEPCEAACFAGDGRACAIYGEAVNGLSDAPLRLKRNIARGRRAVEHGCQLGNLGACCLLQEYNYDYTESGKHAACEAWLALCDRGDLRSCSVSAACLMWVPGFPHDVERAIALVRTSCDKGQRDGCRELALMTERGVYIESDPPRAFALMQKACSLDDPSACAHAGRYFERGVGTKPDLETARKLYRGACARGVKQLPCEALERLGETPPAVIER